MVRLLSATLCDHQSVCNVLMQYTLMLTKMPTESENLQNNYDVCLYKRTLYLITACGAQQSSLNGMARIHFPKQCVQSLVPVGATIYNSTYQSTRSRTGRFIVLTIPHISSLAHVSMG